MEPNKALFYRKLQDKVKAGCERFHGEPFGHKKGASIDAPKAGG